MKVAFHRVTFAELPIFCTSTQFPQALSYSWQELWTVVQWQDPYTGVWHDVEGWQGTLDGVKDKVGRKTWWVADGDLGTGPFRRPTFRWSSGRARVAGYQGRRRLLGTSEPFDLPGAVGATVTVEVVLTP